MDRDEYLEMCKKSAHKYLEKNDCLNAVTAMASDLKKHPDFKNLPDVLINLGFLYGMHKDISKIKMWIDGFS